MPGTYISPAETGFYLTGTRYYDPEIGRFINADNQIADVGGEVLGYNMFAYCMNNPVNMSDPTGNWPKWATKLVVGVVATAAAVAITVATGGAAAPVLIGVAASTLGGAAIGAVNHRVTTGSWEGAGKATLNGAVDGFMVGGLSALGGAVISTGVKAVKTAKQGITIGRGMDKVNQAAGLTDTATYSKSALWKPLKENYYNGIKRAFGQTVADRVSCSCNKLYIKTMRSMGAVIYDSGLNGYASAGLFYGMEQEVLKGYANLIRLF